jgi:hypothetical protein
MRFMLLLLLIVTYAGGPVYVLSHPEWSEALTVNVPLPVMAIGMLLVVVMLGGILRGVHRRHQTTSRSEERSIGE